MSKQTSIFSDLDVRDPDLAFKNAIKRGLKHPEDYMYMHSDKKYDYFKHYVTRNYIRFRNRKDPLKKMEVLWQK